MVVRMERARRIQRGSLQELGIGEDGDMKVKVCGNGGWNAILAMPLEIEEG